MAGTFSLSEPTIDPPPRQPLRTHTRGQSLSCATFLWDSDFWSRDTGGVPCAVPTLCEKQGVFGPVSPDCQADRGKYCAPIHWTARILSRSKNSDNELKEAVFHTENARLLSKSAGFALWLYKELGHGNSQSAPVCRAVRACCTP